MESQRNVTSSSGAYACGLGRLSVLSLYHETTLRDPRSDSGSLDAQARVLELESPKFQAPIWNILYV